MKIALRHLEPNPFRGDYKLDPKIVQALKCSIRASGFWDNLIGRKILLDRNSKPIEEECFSPVEGFCIQICYGHHRLAALKDLVKESVIDEDYEIEVPILRLDDTSMVRIMALERAPDFGSNTSLFDQTVDVARKYIANEVREVTISADDLVAFVSEPWKVAQVKRAYARLGLNADGTLKNREEVIQ